MNPSVTATPCQLPLAREPCGQCPLTISHGNLLRIVTALTRPVSLLRCSRCIDQSPPCQRGVPRQRRGGGIPQAGRFPHRFVLSRSTSCESLSQKSKIFASSLWQGSLWGAATKPPWPLWGWFGEAKPGGFPRLAGFHIGLYFQEVPTVNPSVTATPCQLPLAREPCGQCPLTMRTGIFCESLLPLQCPVSAAVVLPGAISAGSARSQFRTVAFCYSLLP